MNKIKEKLKALTGVEIVLVITGVLILIGISFLIGIEYVPVVLFIFLFIKLANQGMKENPLSPNEVKNAEEQIKILEREKQIIESHVKETNDLDAKIRLSNINGEIDKIKNEYNFK